MPAMECGWSLCRTVSRPVSVITRRSLGPNPLTCFYI